jgi:hypothetical protein
LVWEWIRQGFPRARARVGQGANASGADSPESF